MKRFAAYLNVMILFVLVAVPLLLAPPDGAQASAPVYQFVGGSIKTSASSPYGGGIGVVYPMAFDATRSGGLVVVLQDVNMSMSRLNLPNPLTGACPVLWPNPKSTGYYGGGVTNDANLGPENKPKQGAWLWLFNHHDSTDYYLVQTFYNPGFVGPDPGLGWNTPYRSIGNCGWNGPYGNDPAYDTFDLKLEFQLQANGSLRLTPTARVHASTDPFANPAMQWLTFCMGGNCTPGVGYIDIPAGTMDFTRVRPFVLVANGLEAQGSVQMSWSGVEVFGVPNTAVSISGCSNGGWKMYTVPTFSSESECVSTYTQRSIFLSLVTRK